MARVLLVDDAPAELAVEHSFLGRTGSLLRAVGNEAEILEQARALHPDLILLEAKAPLFDPLACCRAIKSDDGLRAVPVVLLATAGDRRRWLAAGGDGVAARPLTSVRLMQLVRRYVPVLEREHDRAPVAARVHYVRNESEGLAFTRDIGVGGVFLHAGGECSLGDQLEMAVRLPVHGEDEVRATGRVVRVEGNELDMSGVAGVGVRFERLAPRDRIEIGRFVREHAGGTP